MLVIILGCLTISLIKANSICYTPYGCFSDVAPFTDRVLPQSPSIVGTTFYLHRRDLASPQLILPLNASTIKHSHFEASKKTVIITHGWKESKSSAWIGKMVAALLQKGDMNIVIVDWSVGSKQRYHISASNCRLVGKQISYLVETLHSDFGLQLPSVHLIGFSLGAQIMGYAGRSLLESARRVGRITGLDPAAPSFEFAHPDVRLDETDAEFVDIVHTNARHLLFGRIGINQISGHLDLYPNGGKVQPDCHTIEQIFTMDFFDCSHMRAPEYFTATINSACPFTAYPCNDFDDFERGSCTSCPSGGCPKMGYDAERPAETGKKFYLLTNSEAPFCVYHYKISFYTGTKWFAGLYFGNVEVEIFGSIANSGKIQLPWRIFSKGSTESFIVGTTQKLGSVTYVSVSDQGKSWYLEKVVVEELQSQKRYTISFNKWLKRQI